MNSVEMLGLLFAMVVSFFLLFSCFAMGSMVYMFWKMIGAFRWMEMSEASRARTGFWQVEGEKSRKSITKEEKDGAFVPSSDFNAWLREEASQVSQASGMDDKDAVELIMEKIREQNSGRNSAEV